MTVESRPATGLLSVRYALKQEKQVSIKHMFQENEFAPCKERGQNIIYVCVCIYIYTHTHKTQNRPCTIKNLEAHSCNHYCSRQAISVTYSERVLVALGIQHAIRMSDIILLSEACPAVYYLSTICHKRYDFRKTGVIEYKLRVSSPNVCLKYFSITE